MKGESYQGSDGQWYAVARLNKGDSSRLFESGYMGSDRYDSRCPACWRGGSHSEMYHRHFVEVEGENGKGDV